MKKLIIVLLLFLPKFGFALTLGEIRTNVRVLIKDSSSTRYRYTDAQLNTFINEAQRDVINNTMFISNKYTFTTTMGTTYYAMPSDFIQLERVTYNKKNFVENSLISQDGAFNNSAWELTGGLPQSYFQRNSMFGYIGFYPYPNSVSSTGTVVVDYYAKASDMSSDSSYPFNDDVYGLPYHDLLIYYAAYRAFLLQGETEKATLYRQEYESRLAVMSKNSTSKNNYLPSLAGPSNSRK